MRYVDNFMYILIYCIMCLLDREAVQFDAMVFVPNH